MARFPSGQRGQTVNLLAQPSQVRILVSPPFPTQRRGSPPAHCDGRLLCVAARSRLTGFFVRPAPLPASLVSGSSTDQVTAARPSRTPATASDPILHLYIRWKRSAVWRRRCTRSGCSSMVERQPSKLHTRVRFPTPAPPAPRRPPPAPRRHGALPQRSLDRSASSPRGGGVEVGPPL